MNDKTLLLAKAMNDLDDRFIEEAHSEARGVPYQIANRRRTVRQIAAVACLCLLAIGVAQLPDAVSDMNNNGEAAPMDPGSVPDFNSPLDDNNDDSSSQSPSENQTEILHETETETQIGT